MTLSAQHLVNRIAEWSEDNNVPLTSVHVIGSAAMFLHGIVVDVEEIDIQLDVELYGRLSPSYMEELRREDGVFDSMHFEESLINVSAAIERDHQQYGAFVISTLEQLRNECVKLDRPKDRQKITLIDAHLSTA